MIFVNFMEKNEAARKKIPRNLKLRVVINRFQITAQWAPIKSDNFIA